MQLQLNVNGAERLLELDDPQTPLVFVLRDWLGLLGTKFSCLEGICGACTVHVDGVAARACQLPAGQMTGTRITTIEALSADGSHPVQRAWIAHQVPQCGWCQSGQIMQAAAFLAQARDEGGVDMACAAKKGYDPIGDIPRGAAEVDLVDQRFTFGTEVDKSSEFLGGEEVADQVDQRLDLCPGKLSDGADVRGGDRNLDPERRQPGDLHQRRKVIGRVQEFLERPEGFWQR